MARLTIPETTSAVVSNPFRVRADERVSVRAWGLANAETIKVQIDRGDGVFQDVQDSTGTLTATDYQTVIQSGGLYRLNKSATAGLSGAAVD